MILRNRSVFLADGASKLQPGGTTLCGTTQTLDIETTWPLVAIKVFLNITCAATAPTIVLDGILNALKWVELIQSPGLPNKKAGARVSCSGKFLLDYCHNVGLNLDTATLHAIAHSGTTGLMTNSGVYRICYTIPLVHPQVNDPLATRMLFDVQNHENPPQLKLTFATLAEIASANQPTAVNAEVYLVRADMTQKLNSEILADGGYLDYDLFQQDNAVTLGYEGPWAFLVQGPGRYMGILGRMYKGGAAITRGDISKVVTVGSESLWKLTVGGNSQTLRDWRMKYLKTISEESRVLNSATLASSPQTGPALAAATLFQEPVNFFLDFLNDGILPATELGSTLDTDRARKSGLKVEIQGDVSTTATNPHTVQLGGHRLISPPELLAKWITVPEQ